MMRKIRDCGKESCDFGVLVTPDYVLLNRAKDWNIPNLPKWVDFVRRSPRRSQVDLGDDIFPYTKAIIGDQVTESRNKGIPEEIIRAQTARWSKPENSTIMFRVSGNSLEPSSYMLSKAETEHLLCILGHRKRGESQHKFVSGFDWYESWLGSGGPRLIEQKFDELAVNHYVEHDVYPTEKDCRENKPSPPLQHVARLGDGSEVHVLVGRSLSTIAILPSLIKEFDGLPNGERGLAKRGLAGVVGCYGGVHSGQREAIDRQMTSLSSREVLELLREKVVSLVIVNRKVAEVQFTGVITNETEIADIVGWELAEGGGGNRPQYRLIFRKPDRERRKSLVYVWKGVLALVNGDEGAARQAIKNHAEHADLTHDIGVTMVMEHLEIRGWRYAWEFSAYRDASIEILGYDGYKKLDDTSAGASSHDFENMEDFRTESPGLGVTSSVEILLSACNQPEIITAAMSRLKNEESSDYLDGLAASIDIECEAQGLITAGPAVPDVEMAVIPLRCNGLQWQRHPRLGKATRSAVPNLCRLIKRRGGCGLQDVADEYEARGATVTIQTASERKGWRDLTQAFRMVVLEYELSEDQRKVINTLDRKDEFVVLEVNNQERLDKGLVIFNNDDRTTHLMWNKCRDSLAFREVLVRIEIEKSTLSKNDFINFNERWRKVVCEDPWKVVCEDPWKVVCGGPWKQLDMYEYHPRAIEQVTKADMKKMTADELHRLMSLDKADVLDMQEHRQSYVLSAERVQASSASLQTRH